MKCATVRSNLAGYLDDALVSGASEVERVQIRQHLDACSACREELQSYRKLSLLLSRAPRVVPPADRQGGRIAFDRPHRQSHAEPACKRRAVAAAGHDEAVAGEAAPVRRHALYAPTVHLEAGN